MSDAPDKNPQAAKIKKGLPPRREHTAYQTTRDIVIPAGTILRDDEDVDFFGCDVGFGPNTSADFQMEKEIAERLVLGGVLKRVIAA